MSRPFEPGGYDDPAGYPQPGGYGGPPGPRPKSGAVTAVAIVNFVVGGLSMACGFLLAVGAAVLGGIASGAINVNQPGMDPNIKAKAAEVTGTMGTILVVLAVVMIIEGVLMIIAGVGVIQRKTWGRILTLVVGIISGVIAVGVLLTPQPDFVSAVIQGGYCVFVLIVLLNKQNAAEFT